MSDAMQIQDHVGDGLTTGTTGNATPEKLVAEAIPKVGEHPEKTSSQPAASGNVFSEFGYAAYQSGIERPLNSLKQMVGMQVESTKPEPELHGAMEAARVVGSATGQIVDFMLLSKFAHGALNKVAAGTVGAESATLKALAHNQVARATFTSASVGFVNGAFLTPLNNGESSARRLGNGLVDAGSFAMMGGLRAGLVPAYGEGLVGRLKAGSIAGLWGGATEAVLSPLSHGQLPDAESVSTHALAWAAGSVIGGEALRGVGKGLNVVRNIADIKPNEATSETRALYSAPGSLAENAANDNFPLAKPVEMAEARTLPPIANTLPGIFKDSSQVARVFENAPHDAALMDQLGISYTEKLSALGLPSTATPLELFDKVAETSTQVSDGNPGFQTHTFEDGSKIYRQTHPVWRHGRSLGKVSITSFETPDDASITHKTGTGHYFDSRTTALSEWSFKTPSVTGAVGKNGEIAATNAADVKPADKVENPVIEPTKPVEAQPTHSLAGITDKGEIERITKAVFDNSGVVITQPPPNWQEITAPKMETSLTDDGHLMRVTHPEDLTDPAQAAQFRQAIVGRHLSERLLRDPDSGRLTNGYFRTVYEDIKGIFTAEPGVADQGMSRDKMVRSVLESTNQALKEKGSPLLPIDDHKYPKTWLSDDQLGVLKKQIVDSGFPIPELTEMDTYLSRSGHFAEGRIPLGNSLEPAEKADLTKQVETPEAPVEK
jgi:hypothetical protein